MEISFIILLIVLSIIFLILSLLFGEYKFIFALAGGILCLYLSFALLGSGYDRISGISTLENSTSSLDNSSTITTVTEIYTYEGVKDKYTKILGWIFILLALWLLALCIPY